MNYMPVRKKFSQGNYDANDASGKKAVIKFLEKRGLSVKENPDKYGIDLIANGTTCNGKVFDNVPIEVEDVANKGATSENTNILDKPTQFPTAISDLDYRLNDTGGDGPTMTDLKKSVARLSSRLN